MGQGLNYRAVTIVAPVCIIWLGTKGGLVAMGRFGYTVGGQPNTICFLNGRYKICPIKGLS